MSADRNTVAVGYVRVATGSARKREASVYLQRQAILRYAQIHGIRIARFFADHDCVADITIRQGLSDAMEYIAKGKACMLMVVDITRLSRSMEDCMAFIDRQQFLRDGLGLILVQERIDTRTETGRLLLRTMQRLVHTVSCIAEGGAQ